MFAFRALNRVIQPKKVSLGVTKSVSQTSLGFFNPESNFVSFTNSKDPLLAKKFIDSLSMLGSDTAERRYPLKQFLQLEPEQQDLFFKTMEVYKRRTTYHSRYETAHLEQLDAIFAKKLCIETPGLNC